MEIVFLILVSCFFVYFMGFALKLHRRDRDLNRRMDLAGKPRSSSLYDRVQSPDSPPYKPIESIILRGDLPNVDYIDGEPKDNTSDG